MKCQRIFHILDFFFRKLENHFIKSTQNSHSQTVSKKIKKIKIFYHKTFVILIKIYYSTEVLIEYVQIKVFFDWILWV